MSRELTEKKRGNKTPSKGVVTPKMTQPPFRDYRTPYTGNTQAVFTEVEGKRIISTHNLLNAYIKNLKDGIHNKPETKAESDKLWLSVMSKYVTDYITREGYTKQDYVDYIHEYNEPIPNNYSYTFTNNTFEPVDFKITKIGKVFGFTRQDTGECCNFTIIKDKLRGGFTYKLQPLDYFNLPEWVGG